MDEATTDDEDGQTLQICPRVGIYHCVFCEQLFSMKAQLKLHYFIEHQGCVPDYEGKHGEHRTLRYRVS